MTVQVYPVGHAEVLLSTQEVAEWLNVSVRTLAKWRREKDHPLVAVRTGRKIGYRRADVERFLHIALIPGADTTLH